MLKKSYGYIAKAIGPQVCLIIRKSPSLQKPSRILSKFFGYVIKATEP